MVNGAPGFTISRRTLEGLNGNRLVFAQPTSILFFVIPFSRTTVYGSKVLFVDIRQASTVAALDFILVRCFQWAENRYVTGLCLVRRVSGQST
jgi:hypothetical protein